MVKAAGGTLYSSTGEWVLPESIIDRDACLCYYHSPAGASSQLSVL